MTELVDLSEIFTIEPDDLFLTRQSIKDGTTTTQLSNSSLYPVGHILILALGESLVSPSSMGILGTWVVLEDGITLSPVSSGVGGVSGVAGFDRSVPLKLHTHDMEIEDADSHTHTIATAVAEGSALIKGASAGDARGYLVSAITQERTLTTAGVHGHLVTIDNAGVSAPTISIRGKHVPLVMWERIA